MQFFKLCEFADSIVSTDTIVVPCLTYIELTSWTSRTLSPWSPPSLGSSSLCHHHHHSANLPWGFGWTSGTSCQYGRESETPAWVQSLKSNDNKVYDDVRCFGFSPPKIVLYRMSQKNFRNADATVQSPVAGTPLNRTWTNLCLETIFLVVSY